MDQPLSKNINSIEIIVEVPPAKITQLEQLTDAVHVEWWALYIRNTATRAVAWFTYLAAVAMLIIFVHLVLHNGLAPITKNHLMGPSSAVMVNAGAVTHNKIAQGEYVRLFKSLLLVPSLLHCTVNMLELVYLGFQQEDELKWMFPILLFWSGVSGNLLGARRITTEYISGPIPSLEGMKGTIIYEILFCKRVNKKASCYTLLIGVFLSCCYGYMGAVDWLSMLWSSFIGFWLTALYRVKSYLGKTLIVIILLCCFVWNLMGILQMKVIAKQSPAPAPAPQL